MVHRQHTLHHACQQRLAARRFFGERGQHAAELFGHAAQRAGQRAELVVGLAGDGAGVLLVHQFLGERLDAADAPAEGAGNQEGHQQRGRHGHVDLAQRHGQPQNAGPPRKIRGHRQVTQVGIQGGAMAHRRAGGAGQRLANLRPPAVVLHTGGIVLRVGEHHAVAGDDGDARLGFGAGAIGPRLERRLIHGGQSGPQNARLGRHGVLGVLQFARRGVARQEDGGAPQGHHDEQQRREQQLAQHRGATHSGLPRSRPCGCRRA